MIPLKRYQRERLRTILKKVEELQGSVEDPISKELLAAAHTDLREVSRSKARGGRRISKEEKLQIYTLFTHKVPYKKIIELMAIDKETLRRILRRVGLRRHKIHRKAEMPLGATEKAVGEF